jgi:5,10-methylene-tetrahydrofolate dehydrogenase/methenyl tetrahydrofolate cyclohydrolase
MAAEEDMTAAVVVVSKRKDIENVYWLNSQMVDQDPGQPFFITCSISIVFNLQKRRLWGTL